MCFYLKKYFCFLMWNKSGSALKFCKKSVSFKHLRKLSTRGKVVWRCTTVIDLLCIGLFGLLLFLFSDIKELYRFAFWFNSCCKKWPVCCFCSGVLILDPLCERSGLNVHQQWLRLTLGRLTLGWWQMVHHTQWGVQAPHKWHQTRKVHHALGPTHQRCQRAHRHRNQDLCQEVLTAEQGDVHPHSTPGPVRWWAAELQEQHVDIDKGWQYVLFPTDMSWSGVLNCLNCLGFANIAIVFIRAESNEWKVVWPIACRQCS